MWLERNQTERMWDGYEGWKDEMAVQRQIVDCPWESEDEGKAAEMRVSVGQWRRVKWKMERRLGGRRAVGEMEKKKEEEEEMKRVVFEEEEGDVVLPSIEADE